MAAVAATVTGGSSSSSTTTLVRLTTVTTTAVGGTSSTTVTEIITSVSKPVNPSLLTQETGSLSRLPQVLVNSGEDKRCRRLHQVQHSIRLLPRPPAIVSSSSIASAPSPRVFIFDDPANATLCSPFVLSWAYSGQAAVAMTLTAQPRDVFKSNSTITPSSTSSETRILTTSVLSTADSFTWSSVDVREGWYIAKAFDTAGTLGISAGSDPFYLKQGSDTGCLVTQPITTISISSQVPSSTPSSPVRHKNLVRRGRYRRNHSGNHCWSYMSSTCRIYISTVKISQPVHSYHKDRTTSIIILTPSNVSVLYIP